MKKIFLIVWVSLMPLIFFGQKSYDQLSFEHINNKQGIENPYNHFIFKDSEGFTWLSSTEGIYRFDGYKVDFFTPNKENSKGLLGKSVQGRFMSDSNRNIWFSTNQGINCYNLDSKKFTSLQLKDSSNHLIPNDYCLFYIENDSVLWARADWKYIISYNLNTKKQKIITKTKGARFAVDTLQDGKINTIYACPWIQDSGFELIAIKDGNLHRKTHYLKNGVSGSQSKSIEILGGIVQNPDTIWFFSNRGLISFEPNNSYKVTKYSLPKGVNNIIRDGDIYKNKYLFLAVPESGLWLFDIKEKKFERHYSNDKKDSRSIKKNSLGEVYIDDQNHLWAASLKSADIDQCWLESNQFVNPLKGISSNQLIINSIIEDSKNRVWCSTSNLGVFLFDLKGNLIETFNYKTVNTPDFNAIQQLISDKSGAIWGINDKFIFKFNEKEKKWKVIFHSDKMKLLNFSHLSEKYKLVSTNQDVFKLALNEKKDELNIKQTIISTDTSQVFYFYFDERDNYFFPDEDNNLLIYHNDGGNLYFIQKLEIKAEIFSTFWDSNFEKIWLATLNGLIELDTTTWKFKSHFIKGDPLFDTKIYTVLGDNNGKLWLTTNNGLWQYNPKKKEAFQFRKEDGLPSDEFSLFAKLKSSDGKIWLGTNEGLVTFNPNLISPYPYETDIHIKSFKINNTLTDIKERLKENNYLKLNHKENTLEFNLIGISNYLNDHNQIHFLLEGYDEKWMSIKNGESIFYKKLPPGKYTFQYYSTNANGLKGNNNTIEIKVLPPIYLNPMYMIPLLLALFFGGYKFVQWYYRQKISKELERQKQVYNALQTERSRIAGEMHDDLGGGLYSIKNLSYRIRNVIPSKEIPDALSKIENKASELVENMREIIWAMDARHDSLPELVAYVRQHFVNFFNESNVICKAQIPDEYSEDIIISGKKRRNVSLCIKEIAHNIVKHADATEVELGFIHKNDRFKIWIKDNGKGINFKETPIDAHGIKNMKQRMIEIDGNFELKNKDGTFITLDIPLNNQSKHS